MKILDLYKNDTLQTFFKDVNFFRSKNRKGIGITVFPNKKLLIKAYLEIKEEDNLDLYSNTLKNEFLKFKKFKEYADFTIPSSFAVGKKISSDFEIYDYYHIKFKDRLHFNNYYYKLNLLNLKLCKTGFSKEFSSNVTFRKKYFYIFDNDNKHLLNKIFNLNLDISNIDHFEVYSKDKTNFKINFIYNQFNMSYITDLYTIGLVEELNSFFNKTPVYSGITNKNEISIYYSFTL